MTIKKIDKLYPEWKKITVWRPEHKIEPEYWKSLKTNNLFNYNKYNNHGYGGIKRGKEDLPKDEYPYTIKYKEIEIPKWLENSLKYER